MISHRPGSVDDVIAAVDIERLAGDKFGPFIERKPTAFSPRENRY
jgi:hypothetical protein